MKEKEFMTDECGQVLETVYDYDQQIRLTGLSNVLLDYRLYYDGNSACKVGTFGGNYNGNINAAKMTYLQGGFTDALTYCYTYDDLNRLVDATASYSGVGTPDWQGDEQYAYDKIGNLRTQVRYIDANKTNSLNYNYTPATSRLGSILEVEAVGGVPNGTELLRNFAYDNNGNLMTDSKKNITATEYGRANLPWVVFKDDKRIEYLYDAADQRIGKHIGDDRAVLVKTKSLYLASLISIKGNCKT